MQRLRDSLRTHIASLTYSIRLVTRSSLRIFLNGDNSRSNSILCNELIRLPHHGFSGISWGKSLGIRKWGTVVSAQLSEVFFYEKYNCRLISQSIWTTTQESTKRMYTIIGHSHISGLGIMVFNATSNNISFIT